MNAPRMDKRNRRFLERHSRLANARGRGIHMADIKKVFDETLKLDRGIQSLLSFSAFERNGDLSGLHIDFEDSEQLFLTEELREIMEKLSDVHFRLKYLSRPVRETGRLHKNRSGRYETASGHYYTSGQGIEALITDGYPEVAYWVWTRVEHNGNDYYLVGHKDVSMDGLTVRVREGV